MKQWTERDYLGRRAREEASPLGVTRLTGFFSDDLKVASEIIMV